MVRSILPSRYARQARGAKATEKRRVRRAVRQDLHSRDLESTAADLLRDALVTPIVSWRRAGDKLSHFLRWCSAITRGMPPEQTLAFVRRVLPRNLIGDHAYGHWEGHLRYHRSVRIPWSERRRRELQSFEDGLRHRLRRACASDPSLIGRLNARIKEARAFDERRRLLLGIHDIDAFVHDLIYGTRPGQSVMPQGWSEELAHERWIVVGAIAEVEIANGPSRRVELRGVPQR
jgi:hypothetical protein